MRDFPVSTRRNPGWTEEFCTSLHKTGRAGKVMWKISCRPDEVDQGTFEFMKKHGLFRVFLGIEDGTDDGLKQMNKGFSLSDNIGAIQILKNPEFLDYDFLDKSMNDLFHFLSDAFDIWFNAPAGLLNVSKWADMYLSVFSFYNGRISGIQRLSDLLRETVAEAKLFLIETVIWASHTFESGDYLGKSRHELREMEESIKDRHNTLLKTVTRIIGKVQIYDLTKELFIQ